MKQGKVSVAEIDARHIYLVKFLRDRLRWFAAHDLSGNLLRHEAVDIPVVVSQSLRIFEVVQDFVSQIP